MKGSKPMNDESLTLSALTVYQPWASLLIWGEKEYETRYRPCPLKKGSRLVIHAGKMWDKDTTRLCQTEPFRRVFAKHGITNPETQLPRGKALGVVIYQGSIQTEVLRDEIFPDERAFGNYQDRRYGWKMEIEQVFTTPFSVRGEQGIFRIDITPGLSTTPPAPVVAPSDRAMTQVVNFKAVKKLWNPDRREWSESDLIYCGRVNQTYNLPESIWHNPYTGTDAIERFREHLSQSPDLLTRLGELRGMRLVCWCAPDPCHCEVLLEELGEPVPDRPGKISQPGFWSDDIYQSTGNTANDEYIYQKHMEYIREIDEKWRVIRAAKQATDTP